MGSKSPKPVENGQMITLLQSHRSDHLPLHSRDQEIYGSEANNRSDMDHFLPNFLILFFLGSVLFREFEMVFLGAPSSIGFVFFFYQVIIFYSPHPPPCTCQ